MEALSKQVWEKAHKLARFDQYENSKCFKKGMIKRDSISKQEYRKRLDDLLKLFQTLDAQSAQRLSTNLRNKYHNQDPNKLVEKLKKFNTQLESECWKDIMTSPGGDDKALGWKGNNQGTDADNNVYVIDVAPRFEKMEAVFTGTRLGEIFCDDQYHRQCEEIELLLEGREVNKAGAFEKRDVGQENELLALTEILKGCVRSDGRGGGATASHFPTAPNTARTHREGPSTMTGLAQGNIQMNIGQGGTVGAGGQASDTQLSQTTPRIRIDPKPKCLMTRQGNPQTSQGPAENETLQALTRLGDANFDSTPKVVHNQMDTGSGQIAV